MWLPLLVVLGLIFLYRWYKYSLILENLTDKYVFITGCDSGFGNLLAKQLDKRGMKVLAACLTETGAESLKKEASSRLQTRIVNVTNFESVRSAAEWVNDIVSDQGLWGLVNNAGISIPTTPNEWLTKDDFVKILNVNLLGLIDVTLNMLPLIRRAHGRVVNVSSICGRVTLCGGGYCLSKYGVESFSDSLRREMIPFGVKVCIIEPGFFKTELSNSPRFLESVKNSWEKLPDEVRKTYGDDFFEKYCQAAVKGLSSTSKNICLVTTSMEHALTAVYPKTRYSAGWDAKLFFLPLSYCPAVLGDYLLSRIYLFTSSDLTSDKLAKLLIFFISIVSAIARCYTIKTNRGGGKSDHGIKVQVFKTQPATFVRLHISAIFLLRLHPLPIFGWCTETSRLCIMIWFLLLAFLVLVYLYKWNQKRSILPNLTDKYVLITGCDSGFGNLAAKQLDRRGLNVLAACLTTKGAEDLKNETSSRLQTVILDVADSQSVSLAAKWVADIVGDKGLWGLVNNAGISLPTAPNEWLTKDDFLKILNVNLLGVVDVTIKMLYLIRKARGRVVNVASIAGRLTVCSGGYCMSKHGVESFSDSLRYEMASFGVKVCIIEPGFFDTLVTNAKLQKECAKKAWTRLPEEVRRSYGQEYYDKYLAFIDQGTPMNSKNLSLVSDCIEHALTAEHPKKRYSAGWDAKLIYIPLSYFPSIFTDFMFSLVSPKPVQKA
ncbi:uncharacterized protein ACMZJ9_001097 [Mantella aurantiaca]